MARFTGKTVIVTGGNSGIGRATSIQFAREGATVAIIARNRESGMETVEEIAAFGGKASFHGADMARSDQVSQAFADIIASHGRFHAAFNNAGVASEANFFNETEFDEFDHIVQTNLYGTYYCMKHQVRHFLENGNGGAIVNCSSISGLLARKKQSAYSASKGGINSLTRVVALEYASRGIRVNAVCPGGVMTPAAEKLLAEHPDIAEVINSQHPIGRLARPEEIGSLVLWLCSDEATNVIGQLYTVDGGYSIQ